uniref:Peptidase S1 domain-containing protein n=1 Tax=Timema tahoe TaxID=61484 RepID=A0A7R9FM87_9NEOP|nr:unnamed protein product [Timema tahoe]
MAHSIFKSGMFRAVCMTVLYAKLVLSKSEVNLEFRRHINGFSQFGEEPPFATELVKVEDNEQHRKSNAQSAPNDPESIHPDPSKAVASNKYLGFSKPRGGFQRITDTEDKPDRYNQAYLNSLRFKLIRTKRETFESPLIVGPLPPGFRNRVNGGDESFTDQRGGLPLDQPLVSNRPVRQNFEREPTRSGLLNEPGRFQPYFSVNQQFSNQPPRQFFENTQENYWNQPVRDPYFQPNYNDNRREGVYRPGVEQNFQGVPWNERTTNQQVTGQGQVSEGEDVQVGGQTDVRDAGSVENQVRGVDVDLAGGDKSFGEGGVSETGDANVGYDEDINNVPSRPSSPLYDYQEEEEEECVCVDYFLCDILNKTVITTGEGLLEPRLAEDEDAIPTPKRKREVKSCPGVQVCCAPPPGDTPIQTIEQRTPTVGSFETCGVQRADPNTISPLALRIQDVDEEETYLGEFPWMLAVLGAAQGRKYICGASLIHPQVALTAAHCVKNFSAGDLLVRAGEWDPRTKDEPLPYQDRAVNSIIRHLSHRPDTLYHDVALLVLQEPFVENDNVGVVCLPGPGARFNLVNCVASGWGQDKLGTQETFQTPLKKVELPIVPHDECQKKLRTTRLGPFFKLHGSFICAGGESGRDTCQAERAAETSARYDTVFPHRREERQAHLPCMILFICAGGESGRDTCQGDGGGPLVCPLSDVTGRYVQVGVVSWGIGCGDTQVPAVYSNVARYTQWIGEQLQLMELKLQSSV